MEVNLLGKIQVRRGTTAERLAVVLDSGEPAWDLDEKRFYTGDGVTPGGIPSDHTLADLVLGNGLKFEQGNGKNVLVGTTTKIGLEHVPPVRLVASKNINSAGAEMSLTMNNVKLTYGFYNATNSKAWIQAVQGTEYMDMRRCTVYNAAFDVNSYDGYNLTTTPLNFDVITYDDSNETTDIVIRERGRVWNVRVFLSGNGDRSTMWADLVYDPANTYQDTWNENRMAPTPMASPTPSPTPTTSATPNAPSVSPTPSPTGQGPGASPTPSASPTPTPSATPNAPDVTPTPSPSGQGPGPEPSVTPSATPTTTPAAPSATPTATVTPSASGQAPSTSVTPTPTPTTTGTPAASSVAPSPTPSPSPNTPEPEPSVTPTPTPTTTSTPAASSVAPSPTPSPTRVTSGT